MADVKKNMTILDDALNCNNCLDWLKNCHAECCKFYEIPYLHKKPRLGSIVSFVIKNPSEDWLYYHRIHGCNIEELKNNKYKLSTRFFSGELHNEKLRINHLCMYLSPEGKCEVHYSNKPLICKYFDVGSVLSGKYIPTPNCFYTIQAMQKLKKEEENKKNVEKLQET